MSYLLRLIACTLILFSTNSNATVIYNDRTNADLSNSSSNPSDLGSINLGSYDVLGHLSSSDYDFFIIDHSGLSIESIELIEWSSNFNGDWWVYINEHNYMHLNQSILNENLLESLAIEISGSELFIGTQTGGLTLDYGFRITTINTIPIPTSAWLFGTALAGLGLLRKR